MKIKRDSSQAKPVKEMRYNDNAKGEKKMFAPSPVKMSSREKDWRGKSSNGKMRHFSTKSVLRAVPKIESTRLH